MNVPMLYKKYLDQHDRRTHENTQHRRYKSPD